MTFSLGSYGRRQRFDSVRLGSRGRRGRRLWGLEGLEDRVLLSADVYMVTNTGNNETTPGSLPLAVLEANNDKNPAGSIIEFDSSVFNPTTPGVIYLNSMLILTNTYGPEVIEGAGTLAGAGDVQIDGDYTYACFSVVDGVTATIEGVTIQHGVNSDAHGAGIESVGNLTVNDTVITGCTSQGYTTPTGLGAGGAGGGIWAGGTLVVTNCTFSNDQADDAAAGIAAGEGGGIYIVPTGNVSITNSTFESDQASLGGGIFNYAEYNYGTYVIGTLNLTGGTIHNCTGGGIDNSGTATISGCTLSYNTAASTGFEGTPYDGGISNDGTATLNGDTIVYNSAEYGSGVSNQGTMTINGTTISNNSFTGAGFGGGIYNSDSGSLTVTASTIAGNTIAGAGFGGGIYNTGSLMVTASTIASNTIFHGKGGGIYNDNIQVNSSTQTPLVVFDSTIAYNQAGQGGGIDDIDAYAMTLINSTIANNSANTAGGGILAGATAVGMVVYDCTIAYNTVQSPGAGGGLDLTADDYFSVLYNTIVALNTDNNGADDIAGSVSLSSDYDLIGVGGSGGLTDGVNGNQVGVANPGLVPLANNGGPTQTIGLADGSPAVNAGSTALASLAFDSVPNQPFTDQRGTGFPRTLDNTVDIGAVEHRSNVPFMLFGLNRGLAGVLMLQTASDGVTQLPPGRKTDLPWFGLNSFQFDFNEPVLLTAADVTLQSARGINYGPFTVSGSGTTYNIKFAQPIDKADRVMITVKIAGAEVFSGRLNVLPGDVNGDGVVNSADLTAIRKDLKGKGSAQTLIYGDVLDEGTVNSSDLAAVKKHFGTKLPRLLAVKHPKAILARALARRHLDIKQR